MKLTSLLLGDLADLFQDSRISGVESSAKSASIAANSNRTQVARLALTVEQRIREVERENTILSLLLAGILKHPSQSQPDGTQKMLDEVAEVLRSGTPASPDILRQMLDLPAQPRTPISDYTKPMVVGAKRPQTAPPAASKRKP